MSKHMSNEMLNQLYEMDRRSRWLHHLKIQGVRRNPMGKINRKRIARRK